MSDTSAYSQLPGELDSEYFKRLVYAKMEDKTLDMDYSELAGIIYGQEYNSDVARRMVYGTYKTLKRQDEDGVCLRPEETPSDGFDRQAAMLRIERQKLSDQRTAYNKLLREQARREELREIVREALLGGNLPDLCYNTTVVESGENDLLVSLNDIHYGANVNNYWNVYNSDVCADMFMKYLDKIVTVASTHHSENCYVWANGDMISGNIHQSIAVTNKENVIEQLMGVSELIAGFLSKLSPHFKNVYFVSVAGNHSRIDTRDRALKDERLDDLVEWYLDARLQNFENVHIMCKEKIDTTMYLIDIRGLSYCGVHGDYDGDSGKIRDIQSLVGRPVYAVLSGHRHHNRIDEVQGVKTVMAGSFLGMDDFCVSRRIFGKPEQLICVCDESGIVCSYDVPLR